MTGSSSNSRRSRWSHIAAWRVLAIVFAAVTMLYTYFWVTAARIDRPPAVELGLDFKYQESEHASVVTSVKTGGPAERAGHYATLFFGLYDDSTQRLNYVNCGHNPPMLLRSDGSLDRLESTATVIGLFETWECIACEIQMGPADLLAIFSDGVTEAMFGEEEYGESRFLDELRQTRRLPLEQVVT